MPIPKFEELFNPLLESTRELGGSASISELEDHVAKKLSLTEEDLAEEKESGQRHFSYRLAWARSYLKSYGLLDNSARGVWALTNAGNQRPNVDPEVVKREVRAEGARRRASKKADAPNDQEGETEDSELSSESDWKELLLEILLALPPDRFERLCQRILRESGFIQVEVTGKTGDGGIDGTGLIRIGGLLTFPTLFQSKRLQGSVGASTVRDFRGAMVGRADRGLIITTGVFTRDARREATRDGAPPIDLIDRDLLLDKLRELRLGVKVEMVERVTPDPTWFEEV